MQPPAFVKKIVGAGLRSCPFALKQQVLTPLLRSVFATSVADGDLDFLRSRRVTIHLRDLGESVQLTYNGAQLVPVPPVRAPDVTISADSDTLLRVATRSVDPDTLFFHRQLSIEGDTELGLAVKNLLDSLDEEQLPQWLQQLLRLMRRWQLPAA